MTYQVPPSPLHFVNRNSEQAVVLDAVDAWRGHERPLCVAAHGLGGMGRTELAFRLVHAVAGRYPDGVLCVDLDELRRGGVVDDHDVLGELLRMLDVGPEWRELSRGRRARHYWSLTHGKRLILIVDNARTGAEVLPLLPASGDSLVIVTSAGPLYELERGAVVELPLPPLEDEHARELLGRLVDRHDPRLTAEPDKVERLLQLCAGIPAVLQVAARWLRRHHRRSLERLLAELTDNVTEKGIPVVEELWDTTCRELGPEAALLYRLLPAHPGTSLTPQAATALLGRGRDAADAAIEELEDAGLLFERDGRLRLHEPVRAHARRWTEKAGAMDGAEDERGAAKLRLIRWYLRQAQRADLLAAGRRLSRAPEVRERPGAPDVGFADKQAALRWLDSERHALFACVADAYARGLNTECWALCDPLWTYQLDHPHPVDILEAFRTGLAAARRASDLGATVRLLTKVAYVLWKQQDFEAADACLTQAESGARSLGEGTDDRKLQGSVLEFRGMWHSARGEWRTAARYFEASRQVHREIGNAYGVLLQNYRWGEALAELGEARSALVLLEEAHTMARDDNRTRLGGRTAFALGGVLRTLGRGDEARAYYDVALDGARSRDAGRDEERILLALARLAEDHGDADAARRHRQDARELRERNGGLLDQ
ncbi:hypothetical protein [Streptomyces sp. NPDC002851]